MFNPIHYSELEIHFDYRKFWNNPIKFQTHVQSNQTKAQSMLTLERNHIQEFKINRKEALFHCDLQNFTSSRMKSKIHAN